MNFWATFGPSCREGDSLLQMFEAGMTGIRLNLSHVSLEQCDSMIDTYHRAAARAGVPPQLIIDMQGPELRVGALEHPVRLEEGQTAILGAGGIPVPEPLLSSIKPGMELLLDDGAILLGVKSVRIGQVICSVIRGGLLHPKKSIAVSGERIRLPVLTDADLDNLAVGAGYGVTGVLQPFCTGKDDLLAVRQALDSFGLSHARVVAKIENRAGVTTLGELMGYSDEICIARGDLGNDMPLWELPGVQKQISSACRARGKPFGVATQLLHSMIRHAVPTRAEVSDIYNAVLDGASTLILTNETAVGDHPVEAMRYLCKTAEAARGTIV